MPPTRRHVTHSASTGWVRKQVSYARCQTQSVHRIGLAISVIGSSMLFLGCGDQRASTGIYVALVSRGPNPFPGMTDGDGLYIMTVLPDRRVRIRHEEIRFDDLGYRIEEVFRTRVERLLLVRVEGPVEFRALVEALDLASSRAGLRYGLITERTEPTPAEPSLFMGGHAIYTRYFVPGEPVPLLNRRVVR